MASTVFLFFYIFLLLLRNILFEQTRVQIDQISGYFRPTRWRSRGVSRGVIPFAADTEPVLRSRERLTGA